MINHGVVRSTVKPERMVIDEYSVWIHENINEIEVEEEIINDKGKTEKVKTIMYEFEMVQYTKEEYIALQSSQTTDIEMALVEIYESLGVQSMAKIYADLIRKGLKTLDDVPEKLKEAVKEILGIVDIKE